MSVDTVSKLDALNLENIIRRNMMLIFYLKLASFEISIKNTQIKSHL